VPRSVGDPAGRLVERARVRVRLEDPQGDRLDPARLPERDDGIGQQRADATPPPRGIDVQGVQLGVSVRRRVVVA